MTDAKTDPLLEDFKSHIQHEDGMDDRMYSKYLEFARQYVQGATGGQKNQLVLMVAALLNDFRVGDADLEAGLDSLTPFFVAEVYNEGVDLDGPADQST